MVRKIVSFFAQVFHFKVLLSFLALHVCTLYAQMHVFTVMIKTYLLWVLHGEVSFNNILLGIFPFSADCFLLCSFIKHKLNIPSECNANILLYFNWICWKYFIHFLILDLFFGYLKLLFFIENKVSLRFYNHISYTRTRTFDMEIWLVIWFGNEVSIHIVYVWTLNFPQKKKKNWRTPNAIGGILTTDLILYFV